jgi:hypothetical protein
LEAAAEERPIVKGITRNLETVQGRGKIHVLTPIGADGNSVASTLRRGSSDQGEMRLATLLFPLYIYPANNGAPWQPIIDVARQNPGLKMMMVVNPGNGPGTKVDQNYNAGIANLKAAGISMLGYVYTKYGSRQLSDVEADVLSWTKMHPEVTGIFVDNMSNKPGFESYYSGLTAYAKSLGFGLVMGNPGAVIPESYFRTVDVAVIYEHGGFPPSVSRLDPYGWYSKYPASFGMIVHDAPALDVPFIREAMTICEYISVTESYHAVPPYFGQLASVLLTP